METPFQRLKFVIAAVFVLGYPFTVLAQDPPETPPVEDLPPPEKTTTKPAPAEEDADWQAAAAQAIEELESEDFATREAATLRLWRIGEKAEPFVRAAAESDSLEVSTRAQRMLGLFKLGIYPDTPSTTIDLINKFRHGNASDKSNSIQSLYNLGAMSTVIKLIRSVDDPLSRRRLVNTIVNQLDQKLTTFFDAEEYDEIESALELAAISDEGMRDLAAFYLFRGSLDSQIEALLKSKKKLDPIEYEQLSWYYRAKGDLESALGAAEKSNIVELVRDVKIAQGDLLAYIKASHNPHDRTIQAYGFKAAAQRLSGDEEGFEKTLEAIRQYALDNPDEEYSCLQALIINGRLTEAIAISRKDGPNHAALLSENGSPTEALAAVGIENPKGPYDEWLTGIKKEISAAQSEREYGAPLTRAHRASSFLTFWGEEEAVEKIFREIGESTNKSQVEFMTNFITTASSLGLSDLAMEYGKASIEKEIKEAEEGPGLLDLKGIELEEEKVRARVGQLSVSDRIVGGIFQLQPSTANFWWEHLKSRFPDKGGIEVIDMMNTLLEPIPSGKEENPKALAMLETLLPGADLDPAEESEIPLLLSKIADLHMRNGKRDRAMELYKKGLEYERPDKLLAAMNYGNLLGQDGRWKEASEYFKLASDQAKATSTTKQPNSFLAAMYAVALERSGRVEEGQALLNRVRLQSLGKPFEHRRIAAALSQLGDYEQARVSSQLAMDMATLDDSTSVYGESLRLGNYLIAKEPERAAFYKERYLLEHLKSHVNTERLGSLSGVRASVDLARARVALNEGRTDDATKIVGDLVDSQPANTSVLEDLYPLLVEAGKEKEADSFYEKLNRSGTAAVELFPNSPSDLNSLAWLKARCGKDLDKALEMSLRSNELRKDSYAYIDTLAEVYFQLGQQEKAIKQSTRAVELSTGDYLLHQQLERFKNDDPLSVRLK